MMIEEATSCTQTGSQERLIPTTGRVYIVRISALRFSDCKYKKRYITRISHFCQVNLGGAGIVERDNQSRLAIGNWQFVGVCFCFLFRGSLNLFESLDRGSN